LASLITHQTPLIQIPQLRYANEVRAAMVANALSIIGLQAGDPSTRAAFEKLLGPGRWDRAAP
jgi:hypothetical protein